MGLFSLLQEKGPPDIDTNEIEYDEDRDFLGEGTFGRVYRCAMFSSDPASSPEGVSFLE